MKLCQRSRYMAALATLAASTSGVALAQSQAPISSPGQTMVYGIAAIDVLRVTNVYNGSVASTQTRIDSSTPVASRLGFRGAEDLGNGLSAVYNLEAGLSLDTGAGNATALFNRSSYVGLHSRHWGTLTVGRQWDVEDGVLGNYFMFAGYGAFKYTEFAAIDDLVNNSVKYVSPDIGGARISALWAPGEGTTGRTLELGANYTAGPVAVGGTWRRAENLAGRADKLSTVGASYTAGPVRLHVGWAKAQPEASGFPNVNAYDLGFVWTINQQFSTALDYIVRDQVHTRNDSAFIRLQGAYAFSKRTSLYANLVGLKNKGVANQRFVGTGAAGQGQDVCGVGIRHAF